MQDRHDCASRPIPHGLKSNRRSCARPAYFSDSASAPWWGRCLSARRRAAANRWGRWPDMSDAILVLNAGSSSFKVTEYLLGEGDVLETGISGNLDDRAAYAVLGEGGGRCPLKMTGPQSAGTRWRSSCARTKTPLSLAGTSRASSPRGHTATSGKPLACCDLRSKVSHAV